METPNLIRAQPCGVEYRDAKAHSARRTPRGCFTSVEKPISRATTSDRLTERRALRLSTERPMPASHERTRSSAESCNVCGTVWAL